MDAAARPLPSDDTTPPVTKMYLADIRFDLASWIFEGYFAQAVAGVCLGTACGVHDQLCQKKVRKGTLHNAPI